MGRCITTYGGTRFDPMDPRPEDLHIGDIAHALSLLCRGNGHVHTFWSVGRHCLCCAREALARGFTPRTALACLLHDASEAYLSDVPSPFKERMPVYRALEERLMDMVYGRFLGSPLTAEEARLVKGIDRDMLWHDLNDLLPGSEPEGPPPPLELPVDRAWRPFADVEREYLGLFRELSGRMDRRGGA